MKPKCGFAFYLLIKLVFDFVCFGNNFPIRQILYLNFIWNLFEVRGQTSPNTKINFLDKQFEQETYYHDLSYLNSNFVNYGNWNMFLFFS